MVLSGSPVEHALVLPVLCVDVGPVLKQDLHGLGVALGGGQEQGGEIVPVPLLDLGALLEQVLDD